METDAVDRTFRLIVRSFGMLNDPQDRFRGTIRINPKRTTLSFGYFLNGFCQTQRRYTASYF